MSLPAARAVECTAVECNKACVCVLCAVCVRHFQAGRDLDPRAGARVVLEQPGGSRSYLSNGSSSSHTRGRGALVLSSSTAALNCSPKPDARQARKASFWISPYGRVPVRVVLASSFWARDSSRPRPNASLGARRRRPLGKRIRDPATCGGRFSWTQDRRTGWRSTLHKVQVYTLCTDTVVGAQRPHLLPRCVRECYTLAHLIPRYPPHVRTGTWGTLETFTPAVRANKGPSRETQQPLMARSRSPPPRRTRRSRPWAWT